MAQNSEFLTLVARLEAAVARLEGLGARADSTTATVQGIASLTGEAKGAAAGVTAPGPAVAAFDELVQTRVGRLLVVADKIGGQVLQSSQLLQRAFEAEKSIVFAISQCKQPDAAGLQTVIQPLADSLTKAHALTEGRKTPAFNSCKAVAESLSALTWVCYTGKDCGMSLPGAHVEESWQSAEFYNNKVLVEYRGRDPDYVEWAKALKELYLPGLRDYVKQFHTRGPAWNPIGVEFSQWRPGTGDAAKKPSAPPPPPKGPPPPPPPSFAPPPPAMPSSKPSSSAGAPLSMSAVFQDINKGESVTAGLKKVTADMKTKNRADRSGAVPASISAPPTHVTGPSVVAPSPKAGKPKFELELERKWVVEHQVSNRSIVIEDCNSRQSVYIFGCKDSLIQVKGKVNTIAFDNCTKTGLVFTDVVAACEIVNCTSVEVQCQGVAPTIAVDNTNGCQLYLSKESLAASITTAKSSEINVLVPGATDDSDPVEHALPEQFVNVYKEGQFVTSPVSHSG